MSNMRKLEKRFYSREEIGEIIGVDTHDTHFKRKVVNTLQSWFYSYEYSRKGVYILATPQTKEEKIAEIAIRVLNLDVRCNSLAFAAFLFLLQYDEEFNTSPWEKREELMKEKMGIDISDRTLRTWGKKLIENNIIVKDNQEKVLWFTSYAGKIKIQGEVNLDDEQAAKQYEKYVEARKLLLKEEQEKGNLKPWETVFHELWDRFKIVFYYCKPFVCNAILNEDLKEMLSLIEDLYTFEDGNYSLAETEEIHIFK